MQTQTNGSTVKSSGMFSGVEQTKAIEGGTYLTEGMYPKLEVLGMKLGQNRKKLWFFAVNLKVIESIGEKALKPGTECSVMVMKHWDSFLRDVRAIAAAAWSVPFQEIDEQDLDLIVSEEQPAIGKFVTVQATEVETKSEGVFTQTRFRPWVPPTATP